MATEFREDQRQSSEDSQHKKEMLPLSYWLQGRGYHQAWRAMHFGARYHRGLRRDGITPEFHRQVVLANFIRTMGPLLLRPEEALTVALLHDVVEDYPVTLGEVRDLFGQSVGESVGLLTAPQGGLKTRGGAALRQCPIIPAHLS